MREKIVDDKKDVIGIPYDVTSKKSTRRITSLAATGNNIRDKVQNIYDLEGNLVEWTLEANYSRVIRGGSYYGFDYIARRDCYDPDYPEASIGSRATLYIR